MDGIFPLTAHAHESMFCLYNKLFDNCLERVNFIEREGLVYTEGGVQ